MFTNVHSKGHCRRRKIRCIASPDVPNRCVNCIRLKKECSFYPVDQQPGTDTRPKAPSRPTGGPNASSASSSPAVGNGSPAGTPSAVMGSGISASNSQGPNADYFSSDASGKYGIRGTRLKACSLMRIYVQSPPMAYPRAINTRSQISRHQVGYQRKWARQAFRNPRTWQPHGMRIQQSRR